jgi:signal transduction histidine kinase
MEAMRGTITVESVEGAGTTFTLEWPVVGGVRGSSVASSQ